LKKKIVLLLFVAFCSLKTLNAQTSTRFGGGFILGLNASQLDGDFSVGYNKKGISAGLRGITYLNDRWKITTDLLYSQRGAVTSQAETSKERNCQLDYLEVPVIINFGDWEKETPSGKKYEKVNFGAGLVYSRLFKTTANENFTHLAAVDYFSKNDFAYTLSASLYVNYFWGFEFRYTSSINNIFDAADYSITPAFATLLPLRGYFLTLQSFIVF